MKKEIKIGEKVFTLPFRYDETARTVRDAENEIVAYLLPQLSKYYTDALGNALAAALNDSAELKAENERLKRCVGELEQAIRSLLEVYPMSTSLKQTRAVIQAHRALGVKMYGEKE